MMENAPEEMEQPSNSNSVLRDKLRKHLKDNRETNRNKENDCFRCGLGEIKTKLTENENLTSKDVFGLASRIKRKRYADAKDLTKLSYSFLQNSENIKTFIEVRDAINIIVKMFTGSDSNLQILACECLCNMSLGDKFCCEKVARSAGSYLITYLDPTNKKLSKTCLWVLSNLSASSGQETLMVLISLKMVEEIMSFVEKSFDNDFTQECCYTIEVFVEYGKNLLEMEEKEKIFMSILSCQNLNQLFKIRLMYKILLAMDFQLNDELAKISIDYSLNILANKKKDTLVLSKDNSLEIIFSIRIIGNLISLNQNTALFVIENLQKTQLFLSQIINNLFELNEQLFWKELLWLTGNFYNNSLNEIVEYLNTDNLVMNLKVLNNNFMSNISIL